MTRGHTELASSVLVSNSATCGARMSSVSFKFHNITGTISKQRDLRS